MESKNRRLALCAEFGAGTWRMVFFFPTEEQLVRPFPGAQRGKWFVQLADGHFKLVEGEEEKTMTTEVILDGLDNHICLKILLPVCIIQPSLNYVGLKPIGSTAARFMCCIDPTITGNIHFDAGRLQPRQSFDRRMDEAYVSLKSFNAPIAENLDNEQQQRTLKWTIRSKADFIPAATIHSKPKFIPAAAIRSNKADFFPAKQAPAAVYRPRKIKSIEERRHQAIAVCWRLTAEDSFFLTFANDGQQQQNSCTVTRIQGRNQLLNVRLSTIKVGMWYRLEYSRYTNSPTHVLVQKISEANTQEIPFQTRVKDGLVQFKMAASRGNDGCDGYEFHSIFGALKILEMPKEFEQIGGSFTAWCSLSPKLVDGQNQFIFVQEEMASHPRVQGRLNDAVNTNGADQRSQENGVREIVTYGNNSTSVEHCQEEEANSSEFEDEVTIQPELLNLVLEKVTKENREYDCRMELSTVSKNAIQITGQSREAVRKCVSRIRTIRNELMKSSEEVPKAAAAIKVQVQPISENAEGQKDRKKNEKWSKKLLKKEKGWSVDEMFLANKDKCVGESSYDQNLTPYSNVEVSDRTKEQLERADELARQILNRPDQFRRHSMKEGDEEAMGKSSATKMKDDNVPRKLRDISIGRRIINNSEHKQPPLPLTTPTGADQINWAGRPSGTGPPYFHHNSQQQLLQQQFMLFSNTPPPMVPMFINNGVNAAMSNTNLLLVYQTQRQPQQHFSAPSSNQQPTFQQDTSASAAVPNTHKMLTTTTTATNKSNSLPLNEQRNDGAGHENVPSWRIWKFECHDYLIVKEKWPTYITKTEEAIFPDLSNIVDAISELPEADIHILPSQMANAIDFNKKVGFALFRDGIVPDSDQHSQQNGGYFSIKLNGKAGNNNGEMDKLDRIFHKFLAFVFGGGLTTEEMRSAVNGIFMRAEVQREIKKGQKNEDYHNLKDLPGKFRFELWIRDQSVRHVFLEGLTKWRDDVQEEFVIEKKIKICFTGQKKK